MPDRVPSDHPSVTTIRGRVERQGGTRRPEIRLPAEAADRVPEDDVVRLVIDGHERHAPVERRRDGSPSIRGAFANARRAREREGTDYLAEWVRAGGIDFGRAVLVDVVVPDFRYGLRAPGDAAVYDASEPPSGGLRDIAEGLDGE